MATVAWDYPRTGIWRFSRRDAILVLLAALHGVVLVVWPVAPLIAVAYGGTPTPLRTISSTGPFFDRPRMNRVFSAALSVLLGIPQTLWRDRHLAHHAGVEWRLRLSRQLGVETALVLCLWTALACLQPRFFLLVYLPGFLAGLGLCAAARALGTRSGAAYQPLRAHLQFLDLTTVITPSTTPILRFTGPSCGSASSPAPLPAVGRPLLRWLDVPAAGGSRVPCAALAPLAALRPAIVTDEPLQALLPQLRTIAARHDCGRRAFSEDGADSQRTSSRRRTSRSSIPIRGNLETAREFLGGDIEYRNERYVPGESRDCDLTVIPLCSGWRPRGDLSPSAFATVLVHDWIWRRRGAGAIVSAAAAEAPQPGYGMRSASLLLVFLLAKAAMLGPCRAGNRLVLRWRTCGRTCWSHWRFAAFDISSRKDRSHASNCQRGLLGSGDLCGNQHSGGARSFLLR